MDKDDGTPRVRQFARPIRETVHADQEIDEAALRLSLQERPLLPVTDGDEIVGVLTQRDLVRARKAAQAEEARPTARVVMSSDIVFCHLDDDATWLVSMCPDQRDNPLPFRQSAASTPAAALPGRPGRGRAMMPATMPSIRSVDLSLGGCRKGAGMRGRRDEGTFAGVEADHQ
jgi:hypothetical protein